MSNTKLRKVRLALKLGRGPVGAVKSRTLAVIAGMEDNPRYPHPPIDLPSLRTAVDSLSAIEVLALDGSRTAIAEMRRQHDELVAMLRLQGHYVQKNCNNDLATFLSSGFEAASMVRTPAQPLTIPVIRRIDAGSRSGELLVLVGTVLKALSYDVRRAAAGGTGTPAAWITATIPNVKGSLSFDGLTPGVIYAFQVRALGRLGYTDWSDSVTRMCI